MTEPTPPTDPFAAPTSAWPTPPGAEPAPARSAPTGPGSDLADYGSAPAGYGSAPVGYGSAPVGYGNPPAAQQWGQLPSPYGYGSQPLDHVVPTYALASPGTRLGAALLNMLLVLVTLGIGYLIWTLVLWGQGTNPGKKMLGLRVVKSDTGQLCTFGDMLLRNFVFGYLVLGLASVFTLYIVTIVDHAMIFGERRQRLLDKMSSTLVVKA